MVRIKGQVGRRVLDLTCEHCGARFQRFKGNESPRAFCSQKCYLASDYHSETVALANAARRSAWSTQPCGNCGADVRRHNSRGTKTFYCSVDCHASAKRKGQKRQLTSHGYVRIFVGYDYPGAGKSGHILEHRKVMQDILGRPLIDAENVHHINGQRADNRPENLELWSTSQPQGQRVVDKIRWAREFLAFYEKEVVHATSA